MSIFGTMRF